MGLQTQTQLPENLYGNEGETGEEYRPNPDIAAAMSPKEGFRVRELPEKDTSRGHEPFHGNGPSGDESRHSQFINGDTVNDSEGEQGHHPQSHLEQAQTKHG